MSRPARLLVIVAIVAAALAFIARLARRGQHRTLARVLHTPTGMNTTPSIWVVTWMMVASVTAVLVAFVQAFQRALVP